MTDRGGEMRTGRAASPMSALFGMRVPDHHHNHYSAIIIIIIIIRRNPRLLYRCRWTDTYHATLLCHYQRVQTFDNATKWRQKSGPGGPIIIARRRRGTRRRVCESMPSTAHLGRRPMVDADDGDGPTMTTCLATATSRTRRKCEMI
jgi:hypothetical protein